MEDASVFPNGFYKDAWQTPGRVTLCDSRCLRVSEYFSGKVLENDMFHVLHTSRVTQKFTETKTQTEAVVIVQSPFSCNGLDICIR